VLGNPLEQNLVSIVKMSNIRESFSVIRSRCKTPNQMRAFNELIKVFDSHSDFLEKRIESLDRRKKSIKKNIDQENKVLVDLKSKVTDINQDIDDTKTELKEYKESIKNK